MIPPRNDGTSLRIHLTQNGIVAVTDPVHLRICELLDGGGMRPSDLSSQVGVASSSLHFVLDKLMESGVVSRHKPNPDKKSVVYCLSSVTVLRKKKAAGTASMDRVVSETSETGRVSWGDLLVAYFDDLGMESPYLRNRYADFLSGLHCDSNAAVSLEDAVFASKKAVAAMTGYGVNIFSLNPLTVIIDGDWRLPKTADIVASLFSKLVHRMSGFFGSVASISDIGNGTTSRYKVIMSNDGKSHDGILRISPGDDSENVRFAVVGKGDDSLTVTNDIQIDILKILYDGPQGVTGIVESASSPRSTVTSNLVKMTESGIIGVRHSDSESASYGLSLPVVLMKQRPVSESESHIPIVEGSSFMDGFFQFVMAELDILGFDSGMLSEQIGRHYAERCSNPRKSLSELAVESGAAIDDDGVNSISLTLGPGPEGHILTGMARCAVDPANGGAVERRPADGKVTVRTLEPPAGHREKDADSQTATPKMPE